MEYVDLNKINLSCYVMAIEIESGSTLSTILWKKWYLQNKDLAEPEQLSFIIAKGLTKELLLQTWFDCAFTC